MATIPNGRFVWYQLNAMDVDAARDFYVDIVNWKTDVWAPEGADPYTMLLNENGPVGGIMAMPDDAREAGSPQHWLVYISTPDVDRSVMQARDHGAVVYVPPTDLPEVGRFAVLADPQGAVHALYTPSEPPEDTPFAPVLGDVSWHELMTNDYEAAFGYYSDLCGWEKAEAVDMGEMGTYQMFGRNGDTIGGMMNIPPDMQVPPCWSIYFRVDDVNATLEKVKALGGQVTTEPTEVPGGDLVAMCMDPQGGAFAIHAVVKAAG